MNKLRLAVRGRLHWRLMKHDSGTSTIAFALGLAVVLALVVSAIGSPVADLGRPKSDARAAGTGTVSNPPYSYSCTSASVPGANVQGSFTFSPSPSTVSFTVFLTYHVPGGAQFVPVTGGSETFPAGSTSPVSFDLSTANVPANANAIRLENSLNTSKSASFLCSELPQLTPTATPTNSPVPPTNTPVPPTATPTNTPVPPTQTPTNTPVPPTATPTNTPVTETANSPTPTATTPPRTHANTPVTATATATRVPATTTPVNATLPIVATPRPKQPVAIVLPNTGTGFGGGAGGGLLGLGAIAIIALIIVAAGLRARKRSDG